MQRAPTLLVVDEVQVVAENCGFLTLTTEGQCPGRAQLEITGATPGGRVALLRGSGPGNTPVPGGPCTGTRTGLSDPARVAVLDADPDGRVLVTPNLNPGACGTVIQALDLSTCGTTNLGSLP